MPGVGIRIPGATLLVSCFWFFIAALPASPGLSAEISDINVRLNGNELFITTSFKPPSKMMDELTEGLSKELVFYIDLFRVWKVWPDEFVLGKKIVRNLKSNQIKREYSATSLSGNILLEKRFKDLDAMAGWATVISDIKLTNVKELEPGVYFVRVTVESRLRKLPPVIGYLLLPFVPEKEFSLSRDSQTFHINERGHP